MTFQPWHLLSRLQGLVGAMIFFPSNGVCNHGADLIDACILQQSNHSLLSKNTLLCADFFEVHAIELEGRLGEEKNKYSNPRNPCFLHAAMFFTPLISSRR